jgi:hypothetical protein
LRLVVRSPALVAARRCFTGGRVRRGADRARVSSRVTFKTAWESFGHETKREARCTRRSHQTAADRPALARLAARGRLPPPGR